MEQNSNNTFGVYKKLTSKEKETLALLKGSPVMDTIIKAIDIFQKDKAAMTIALAQDWDNVVQNRGEILGGAFIVNLVNFIALKNEQAIKAKEAIAEKEKNK